MTTPPPNSPPEALQLALAQIADALKTNGGKTLNELIADKDGYARIIWLLEKLAKASLDWQQLHSSTTDLDAGISPETDRRLAAKLAAMP